MAVKRFRAALIAVALSLCALPALATAYTGGEANRFNAWMTPSRGEVFVPVFLVEFQDVGFDEDAMTPEEVRSLLFDMNNPDSFARYEYVASYGALRVDGAVFAYTARMDKADYEDEEAGFERLGMEVLAAFDDAIDYARCDADGSGDIDAFVLNIAGADEWDSFWYGCQAVWYLNDAFAPDGVYPANYIINDAQPDPNDTEYYVQEMAHEFGHCMGLPDYYIPGRWSDGDGLRGPAGLEMMDDMEGDYSQFSKLMMGWLREDQVSVYTGGTREYALPSAQREGGCVLIPRDPAAAEPFLSEYFLIEYNTADANMAGALRRREEGVRVLHVDAEVLLEPWGERYFKYAVDSEYYHSRGRNRGRRILRLVNDGKRAARAGDAFGPGTSGFGWYDDREMPALPVGVRVEVLSIEGGMARIRVSPARQNNP